MISSEHHWQLLTRGELVWLAGSTIWMYPGSAHSPDKRQSIMYACRPLDPQWRRWRSNTKVFPAKAPPLTRCDNEMAFTD